MRASAWSIAGSYCRKDEEPWTKQSRIQPPDPADQRQRPGPDPAGPGPGQELDNPVIAGFDGSPSSRNALVYAAGMARRVGRPLLVVYVSPATPTVSR